MEGHLLPSSIGGMKQQTVTVLCRMSSSAADHVLSVYMVRVVIAAGGKVINRKMGGNTVWGIRITELS